MLREIQFPTVYCKYGQYEEIEDINSVSSDEKPLDVHRRTYAISILLENI